MIRQKKTIKELIRNKNYECIKIYSPIPLDYAGYYSFVGFYCSKDGKLISCVEGDDDLENVEVDSHYEWSRTGNIWQDEILNGLTIYLKNKEYIQTDINFVNHNNIPIL